MNAIQVTIFQSLTGRFCYSFPSGRVGQRHFGSKKALRAYLKDAGFHATN